MNFVEGELTETGLVTDHFDLEFDVDGLDLETGSEVTMGVRPEDIYPPLRRSRSRVRRR